MKIQLSNFIKGGAIFLFLTSIFLFTGCNDSDDSEPGLTAQEYLDLAIEDVDQAKLASDLMVIDDSLAVWGFTEQILSEPNGVRYKIETVGTGAKPTLENFIKIKYSGKLLSTGVEFDASEGYDTYLHNLIIGFQTTLPIFEKGTIVTLYVPSGFGYGLNEIRDNDDNVIIPENSNLIFEVELLDVF